MQKRRVCAAECVGDGDVACIDSGDGIVRQAIVHHRLDRGLEEAILKLPEVLSWGDIDECRDWW